MTKGVISDRDSSVGGRLGEEGLDPSSVDVGVEEREWVLGSSRSC